MCIRDRDKPAALVLTSPYIFRHVHGRYFLPSSRSPTDTLTARLSVPLTTNRRNGRSARCFEAAPRREAPEGQPTSISRTAPQTPDPVPTRPASHVRVHNRSCCLQRHHEAYSAGGKVGRDGAVGGRTGTGAGRRRDAAAGGVGVVRGNAGGLAAATDEPSARRFADRPAGADAAPVPGVCGRLAVGLAARAAGALGG